MRFWDSSALVPLLLREDGSAPARRLASEDRDILVWALSPIEVLSAMWRRRRTGELAESDHMAAEHGLAQLESVWSTVADLASVERRARRIIAVHPLRGADALQLAAALLACDEQSSLLPLVTFDARLAEAARREGFSVLP